MDFLAQLRQGGQVGATCNRHQVPHFHLESASFLRDETFVPESFQHCLGAGEPTAAGVPAKSENENLRNRLDVHNPAGAPLYVDATPVAAAHESAGGAHPVGAQVGDDQEHRRRAQDDAVDEHDHRRKWAQLLAMVTQPERRLDGLGGCLIRGLILGAIKSSSTLKTEGEGSEEVRLLLGRCPVAREKTNRGFSPHHRELPEAIRQALTRAPRCYDGQPDPVGRDRG